MKNFLEVTAFGDVMNDISVFSGGSKSCYIDLLCSNEVNTIRFYFYNKSSTFIIKNFKKGDKVFIKGTVQVVSILKKDEKATAHLRPKFIGLIVSK